MTTGGAPVISKLPVSVWQEEALARRFRVERELGCGGQAVVVVAYHRELDERVALKFLLPDAAQSSASIARFRREARAAAKIKNEHVVRIIDVCATLAGIPYIVMEYLEGRDLEHVLHSTHNGQLTIPDAVDFVLQASEALAEGHRLGIVHRDLKPANLFCVDREDGFPMIKVLDFGISKIQPLPGDVERTDRYEILGSPRYMSPEQIDASRDVDQRTDIWSLGVILYQCIAGRVPFGGEIVADLWHKIRTATPQALSELRRETPLALNRIVMRYLEKEPARRFANLGEFAEALDCVAPDHSKNSIARILRMTGSRPLQLHSSIPTLATDRTLIAGSSPPRTPTRRRWYALVAACLGATAFVGMVAIFVQTQSRQGRLVRRLAPAQTASVVGTATGKPNSKDSHGAPSASPEPAGIPGSTKAHEDNVSVTMDGGSNTKPKNSPRTAATGSAVAAQSSTPPSSTSVPSSGDNNTPESSRRAVPPSITSAASSATPPTSIQSTVPWIVPPVVKRKGH